MRIFRFAVRPRSGMGTLLKGDTIFGHICWQAAYDDTLFGKPLSALLTDYSVAPFLVVSSAYPMFSQGGREIYALKRPDLPSRYFFNSTTIDERTAISNRKEAKKKCWMIARSGERLSSLNDEIYRDSAELAHEITDQRRHFSRNEPPHILAEFLQPRNTINRLTGTTGEGQFAPFSVEQHAYHPGIDLAIFIGLSDKVSPESVLVALTRIGETGFGKDASVGLGKFDMVGGVEECSLVELGHSSPNACYTLSPSVPERGGFTKICYTPFVRFGRHGDVLAKSQNPFKNPILMAD